jgi:hypothetical protein
LVVRKGVPINQDMDYLRIGISVSRGIRLGVFLGTILPLDILFFLSFPHSEGMQRK